MEMRHLIVIFFVYSDYYLPFQINLSVIYAPLLLKINVGVVELTI